MQRLGIQTGADLRAQSLAFLQQHFGKSAAWYLGIAKGEDDRPVVADRPRKSSNRGGIRKALRGRAAEGLAWILWRLRTVDFEGLWLDDNAHPLAG